jgi:hypothetical protein
MHVKTRIESAWFRRLKLKHDKLLSNFAFNFNFRPYVTAVATALHGVDGRAWQILPATSSIASRTIVS